MTSEMLDIRMHENLQMISKLRLLDDDLMKLVFDKNIEATELLLNIILQRSDLKVIEVVMVAYMYKLLFLSGWNNKDFHI